MLSSLSVKSKMWMPIGVALFAGAIGAGAFAPLEIWFLMLVSIAGFFCLVNVCRNWKWAVAVGWVWGLGYFGLGLSWTHHSMYVYGRLPSVVAALGVMALAGFLAIIPAMAAGIARRLPVSPVVRVTTILPALWTLGELVRGAWLMNFGWLSTGYALIDTIFAGWAPIMGVYGVGFVAVWLVGLLVALFMQQTRSLIGVRATLALIVGALILTTTVVDQHKWFTAGKALEVRLIQPDLSPVLTNHRQMIQERIDRVEAMSRRSAMGNHLDLIVWPEGIYPWPLQRHSQGQVETPIKVAQETGTTVLLNAFDEPQEKRFFNSTWTATPDGKLIPIFAKHHLVPFGEYVPGGFRWFVDMLKIPMSDQSSGELMVKPVQVANSNVALQICYEVMFPEELIRAWKKGNPELIINTANLVWFSDFAADQFTQMTRMRSRETARPTIQAMNNAMSAVINADGRVERLAGIGAQTLDVRVQTAQGTPTPFVRFGLWISLLLAVLLMSAGLVFGCIGASKKRLDQV